MELLWHIAHHSTRSLNAIIFSSGRGGPGEELIVRLVGYATIWMWVIVLGISGWVVSNRMRRRIKKDTEKTVEGAHLTSLSTWIKVDEVEKTKHPDKNWAPESSISDYQPSKRNL
ncbi:MAG TPA: hypothetical protein VHS29_12295 [Candidatus Acidoferrales bacterium]|jgi:hypothetical protein|nr:hypothetical protein [Candidatus Acidoferrales bacterium]